MEGRIQNLLREPILMGRLRMMVDFFDRMIGIKKAKLFRCLYLTEMLKCILKKPLFHK